MVIGISRFWTGKWSRRGRGAVDACLQLQAISAKLAQFTEARAAEQSGRPRPQTSGARRAIPFLPV